ncbi:MAG TPA: acetyl-CoA C-acetyltransferase [Rubrobacteraceae bacterium]|nr:acetyl-CoA C-acetyltransferase [Rubrobacteraceae bacterium]
MSFANSNTEIVISTPLRTAIGTFGGTLSEVPAVDLGTTVATEVLNRSGLDPERVDQVVVGNVLMAGQGMNPGRQVGINAGVPVDRPAMTLNRMCASGLQAIVSAAQEIALGESEVVLAGGIENMDMAPFLLTEARYGYGMGMPDAKIYDHMTYDGLWDIFNDYHMGMTAENVADQYELTREECDEYAARSHQYATQAIDSGYFKEQIVPVEVQQGKETIEFVEDEHVRKDADMEKMQKLPPIFRKDGVVTPASASGVNDGASMMLVTSAQKAEELDLPVAGRLVSAAVAGVDPSVMGIGPVPASHAALKKAGLTIDDMDVVEENEAFASVALAVQRDLQIPEETLNPEGGAISLGHPIGATGAALTAMALHYLHRTGGRYGLVTLCVGGGMGIAGIYERV